MYGRTLSLHICNLGVKLGLQGLRRNVAGYGSSCGSSEAFTVPGSGMYAGWAPKCEHARLFQHFPFRFLSSPLQMWHQIVANGHASKIFHEITTISSHSNSMGLQTHGQPFHFTATISPALPPQKDTAQTPLETEQCPPPPALPPHRRAHLRDGLAAVKAGGWRPRRHVRQQPD